MIAFMCIVEEYIAKLGSVVLVFEFEGRILHMLVYAWTLFDTHRKLLGLESPERSNGGEELRSSIIEINGLEAPNAIEERMSVSLNY